MRTVISLPNMGDPARLVGIAAAADANGWDGVVLWDHIHLIKALALDVFDPWVVLGAAALQTEHVLLGTMVTPLARRRPHKLAKEVITLDHLTAGRAVLGVGLGEPAADEFGMFGEDVDLHRRAAALDEGLDLVDSYLRGEPTGEAHLRPASITRPRPPIWVAGKWPNPKPIARAARWDGYIPIMAEGRPQTPDDIRAMVDAIGAPTQRDDFAIVANVHDGAKPAAFVDAGANWLLWSTWPDGDWLDRMEALASSTPPV